MKSKGVWSFGAFTIGCLLLSGIISSIFTKPNITIDKQSSALNFSDEFLRYGFAGYKRMLSDIIWITTLLESDLSHYKSRDLNSWMYLRFNSISKLDPLFYQNYSFGGQYLSIVKDDINGAAKIFEKGLKHYPNDYSLNFNAAYLYAFETGDYQRASKLYEKVKEFPQRPYYVDTLITKLKFEATGNISEAYDILFEMYQSEKDELIKGKLEADLYSIKAQIDLECLNNESNRESKCERKDFLGNSYIYRDGRFKAQIKFKPYKLHKIKKAP